MARKYSIDERLLDSRLRSGMSLEECFTTDRMRHAINTVCFDHKLNQYDNFIEMCEAYNMSINTVRPRLMYGYSLEKALNWKR